MSTVPDEVTLIEPDASEAVAPASVYVTSNSADVGLPPVTVITGAVVSTTLTVLVALAELPAASVAEYVRVYEPTVEVSTVPLTETLKAPSLRSVAEAPGSVKADPNSTDKVLAPLRVTTGGSISFLSSSVIALIAEAPTTITKTFCMADNSAFISLKRVAIAFCLVGL